MSLPFWVYIVVVGILFSAFMAVKTAREEQREEKEWAEQEGKVYLERVEEERKRRQKAETTG